MPTEIIDYEDEGVPLEGIIAYPDKKKAHPLVIFCHSWNGRDAVICERAKLVTQWGYVGFALDMYGKGVLGKSREQNATLKKPFLENRDLLARRLFKALEAVSNLPYIDSSRIAVVGFGFGGLCALDFARICNRLKGVVCVYGHFDSPKNLSNTSIQAKVLILHGNKDPIVTIDELHSFQNELSKAKVDWQSIVYSHCMHAFTYPHANDPIHGSIYNPIAAKRSWEATRNFLKEVLESP